ncbi:hypothetical protein GJ496_000239 [Pomphorhynchus laevis]|nr:hypothetical protein GJ496_000239 [Pomphorhynchus laevis]
MLFTAIEKLTAAGGVASKSGIIDVVNVVESYDNKSDQWLEITTIPEFSKEHSLGFTEDTLTLMEKIVNKSTVSVQGLQAVKHYNFLTQKWKNGPAEITSLHDVNKGTKDKRKRKKQI